MPSLAGTLPSRWNTLGGQDTSLYWTFAQRCFPGTYDLKFWQTFGLKSAEMSTGRFSLRIARFGGAGDKLCG